jgi:hypothetical protein
MGVAACGSKVDVFEKPPEPGPDSGSVTWIQGCQQPQELASRGQTGDTCDASSFGACGVVAEECTARSFVCDQSGILRISDTTILDCSGTFSGTNPVGWSDCPSALANGHSADTCEGAWTCARTTSDPCCVETAICTTGSLIPTSDPNAPVLVRRRICSSSCQNLQQRSDLARAATCAEALESAFKAGAPCQGSFICAADGADLTSANVDTAGILPPAIYWCADGAVQFVAALADNAGQ